MSTLIELGIVDVRGNSTGEYVTLTGKTSGTLSDTATVTVKATKRGTYVCLTCRSADTCAHSRYVRGVMEAEDAKRSA